MQVIEKLEQEIQELFNSEKYEEAVDVLKKKMEGNDSSDELKNRAAYLLGRIKFYREDYGSAQKYFGEALLFNKEDVFSRLYLGMLREKDNKTIESLRIFSSCLETNPELDQLNHKIQKQSLKLTSGEDDTDNLLIELEEKFRNREKGIPLVSIIVLCYNKLDFTKKCIKSIFKNTKYDNFEVIVVDNASVDDTPAYLEAYGDKIKFIHSDINTGFVGGNNIAFEHAEGEYLLFLNNDTEVTPNWLKFLYNTFIIHPDAGAVGSMLVYPDGTLQEAGGIIFNDATGWNYGKNGKVVDSKYTFVREVDYCSGAALMVKKNLFEKHGRFDERFAPAYFEDTDLCFGMRKLGYKVYYCPLSRVIHYEGATAGTDLSKGFKKYQMINTPKFIDKWKDELKWQYPPDAKMQYQFSNRKKGKRILVIDDIPPFPDRAAGALRHYHTLKQMVNLGYQVTYVHLMGKEFNDKSGKKYFDEFKMQGVEFFWFNYELWWNFRNSKEVDSVLEDLIDSLDLKYRKFDLIYIAFWHIADYFIDLIKKEVPETPILIDTMDVHYLREIRKAEISGNKKELQEANITKQRELNVYSKADCITTVTENDRDVLKKELPDKSIVVLTDVHDPYNSKVTFEERKDFLFIGNFNHNPNEDAVFYFVEKIFPHIKKKLKDCKFYVVGNKPTKKIKELDSKDIVVTGWVPEVKPYLEQCRVSVVPLRFGAGNKGKVGETLSHGLPMVSTTIGAEGMGIVNEEHSFVSDDPLQFAEYCVKLYSDKNTWEGFSQKGKALVASQYSSELMRKRLHYIMSYDSKEAFKTPRALSFPNPPKVSIILVTYNQYNYTKECLTSLRKYTDVSYEVIVIDNKSSDKTVKLIKKDFPEIHLIKNDENLGFPNAVNQGIKASIGEYVLLLNNDTVLTEGWLKRMVEVAENDNLIGMVGPISNEVSGVQIDKEANYKTIDEMHKYASEVKEKFNGVVKPFPRLAFLCTLIRRELINKVGGLDERYSPGNFEDDDFCLRAQMVGYKTVIVYDVFIHHYGSVSFKAKGNDQYADRLETNKKKFVDKWGGTPENIWLEGKEINKRNFKYSVHPNEFQCNLERAFAELDSKDYKYTLIYLEKAFALYDHSITQITYKDLINLMGNIALMINDTEKAQNYFSLELEEDTESARALTGIGRVFVAREMYKEAKDYFEKALAIDSQNASAIAGLNEVKAKVERPTQVVSENDMNLEEMIAKAESYIEKEEFGEAKSILTELLKVEPDNINALNDISVVYILEGNFEKAIEIISRVIELDPENEVALGNMQYLKEQTDSE